LWWRGIERQGRITTAAGKKCAVVGREKLER
jgi:hypothetical protein